MKKALVIVDMQKDFLPGGALSVNGADQLVDFINQLMPHFPLVVATKDWHPKGHISFAANHSGKKVGDIINLGGLQQILWPIHCVQGSTGSDFADGLNKKGIEGVFYKGIDPTIDSYSTFFDNEKKRKTGLEDFLKERRIDSLTIVGVATEYCVLYSVLDALDRGFQVEVIRKGCRPINIDPGDEKKALEEMERRGATIIWDS